MLFEWGKYQGVDPFDLADDQLHETLRLYRNDHTAWAAIRSEMFRRGLLTRYRGRW